MASYPINLQSNLRSLFSYRIWWLAILGILGLYIYLRYDAKVFPSASINLKVPRIEIIRSARQLANKFGYDQANTIESTQFTVDNQAKTFLEYEFGIDQANQLMKEDLPIWFWRTRLCREHEQEEFRIWLNTTGKMQAFSHELENDKRLPSLSRQDALKLASEFIKGNSSLSLDSYTLTKSANYKQPHRVDHSFTWQDNNRDFHGAKLRVQVAIAGNQVSQFNYYMYVPETFQRKFSTLRSSNQLLQSIASIFYSLLQVASIFIFFWAVSTKGIRWRFAIAVAGVLTFIDLLDSFNDIASVIDSYDTEKLFSGYFLEFIIDCAVSGLAKFISCLMLAGSAEFIYRISYPKKVALENIFLRSAYRTKSFISGNVVGHLLVGINLGWIVVYYLAGAHWHVWCPLGIENYQVLSTVVPFFSAISTGISAAINEEFLYRVLALSLFQRLTRSFWLANLFQAAAWGFMHSTYPQEPAYARGIELTAIGLMHGWVLKRYGLLPCLVGHYLFDALVSVKMLFGANDFGLKSSAIIPLVPFFILLIIAFLKIKRWGYRNDIPLQNRALIKLSPRPQKSIIAQIKNQLEHAIAIPVETLAYIRLLSKNASALLFLFAVSCLLLILPLLTYQSINKDIVLSTSRPQIISLAKKELLRRNIDVQGYKVLAKLIDDTNFLDMQYVYEKLKLQQTLLLAKETKQGLYWKVRFFKPLDPKEYIVWFDIKGKPVYFTLVEPEDTVGANLSEDAARDKVETYLGSALSNWQPCKFENSFENKRKARTDYTLTYTIPHLDVADAEFKVSIDVLGDVVSSMESGYDLPDHWLNERNKRTIKDEIFSYMRTAFNVFIAVAGLFWAFGLLKGGYIKWQSAYLCTVFLIALSFLQHLNSCPQFYSSYLTTEPLYSYILRQFTNYVQVLQSNFLYNFCSAALAIAALHAVAPKFKLRQFLAFLVAPLNKETGVLQKSFWLTSWLVAFSVASFHIFINILSDFFHVRVSPGCPQESLSTICDLANMGWPPLAVFVDALLAATKQVLLIAILAGLYKRYCSNFLLYALFVVVFNLVTYSSVRYWQDYIINIVFGCIWEISMWYFIVKFIGVNPLSFFLIGFIESLLSNVIDLIQHSYPMFIVPIILALVFILLPVLQVLRLSYLQGENKKAISVPTS